MLEKTTQTEIIQSLKEKVKAYYVFPEVAEEICTRLENWQTEADTDDEAFAEALTAELQEVSGDKHLAVRWQEDPLPEHEGSMLQNEEFNLHRPRNARKAPTFLCRDLALELLVSHRSRSHVSSRPPRRRSGPVAPDTPAQTQTKVEENTRRFKPCREILFLSPQAGVVNRCFGSGLAGLKLWMPAVSIASPGSAVAVSESSSTARSTGRPWSTRPARRCTASERSSARRPGASGPPTSTGTPSCSSTAGCAAGSAS